MRAIVLICALAGLSTTGAQLFNGQEQHQQGRQLFNARPRSQYPNPPQIPFQSFRPEQPTGQQFINQQPGRQFQPFNQQSQGQQFQRPFAQQPSGPQFQRQQPFNQQFQGQQFQRPLTQQPGRQFSVDIQSAQNLLRSFLQRELEPHPQPDLSDIQNPRQARIVKSDNEELPPDAYSYSFDTSNGIHKDEVGIVTNSGTSDESLAVQGSYSYVGPDGKEYVVSYTADENGFQPAGEHIPPAANVRKTPQLGVPSAALASLAGGGLG